MVSDQGKTIEALNTAIQMEIDGKQFYLKMTKTSSNPLGSKLFRTLASEEDDHRKRFEEIFRALSDKKAWPRVDFVPDGGQNLRTIFAAEIENPTRPLPAGASELDAVQIAIDMESKTYDFYKGCQETSSFETERTYFRDLSGQEREHQLVLLDYLEFLKNPAGWFTVKERHSLDGG
jgi:rubrerythrin